MTTPRYGAGALPLAIAHRGGAGLATENTPEAFARSYALGVRYLETDVRVSADGVCMAFHDATLHRTTGEPGTVRSRTARALDALGVAKLAELLTVFPDACFVVDVKEPAAIAPLARTLQVTNAAGRVCAAGAWDGWLARLAAATGPALTTALGWHALAALDSGTLRRGTEPRFAHLPAGLAPNVRTIAWTVNDAARMHDLLDRGVDGIITDRPDVLREVLIARECWTPLRHDVGA